MSKQTYLWRIGITILEDCLIIPVLQVAHPLYLWSLNETSRNRWRKLGALPTAALSKKTIVSSGKYYFKTLKVKLATYKYNLGNPSKESSCLGRTLEIILITIVLSHTCLNSIEIAMTYILLVITLLRVFDYYLWPQSKDRKSLGSHFSVSTLKYLK